MIKQYNLVAPAGEKTLLAVNPDDAPEFDRVEPYGYHRAGVARCIEVGGRLYALRDDCPDDGLDVWSAEAVEARELELDAAIAAMPERARARFAPDHKPYPERQAQRALDDAEAEARAKGVDPDSDPKVAEKRAALESVKRGSKP